MRDILNIAPSITPSLIKPIDSIRETCICGRCNFKYRFSQDYFGEKIIVIQCADPGCNWLVGIVSATPDHQWYIDRAREYKEMHGEGQVVQSVVPVAPIKQVIPPPITNKLAPKQQSDQLSLF